MRRATRAYFICDSKELPANDTERDINGSCTDELHRVSLATFPTLTSFTHASGNRRICGDYVTPFLAYSISGIPQTTRSRQLFRAPVERGV